MNAHALPRSDEFACASPGIDPEWFHSEAESSVKTAKAICSRCPALHACADYGMRVGVSGVWGGLTEEERKAIRAREGIVAESMASFGLAASRAESIRRMHARGLSPAEIGMTLGVQAETVRRAIREMKAGAA